MALPSRRSSALLGAVLSLFTACTKSSSDAPGLLTGTCSAGAVVAVAGPDRLVDLGATVELTGATLGETGATSILWSFATLPYGSNATLSSTNTLATSFVTDRPGLYLASLMVRDQCGNSLPDLVSVTVGGSYCTAAPPVARITAPAQILGVGNQEVSGLGSTGERGTLSYHWTVTSRPPSSVGSFQSPTSPTSYFWFDRRGIYEISLTVNDGCQDSLPAHASIEMVNSAPTIWGYVPYGPVPVLRPVSFSIYASDAQGDPLTFLWTIVAAPAGSTAALSDATVAAPSFVPDQPGSYSFSLVANDGLLDSMPALFTLTAADAPPVAVAGSNLSARPGDLVQLDGSASSDVNGTPLVFSWTLAAPAGSAAVLAGADTIRPTFVVDAVGTYVATLTVSSGGASGTSSVTVAAWPAVEPLPHRVIDAAYSAPLEQLVTVAADPSALYLLDPRTGVETSVALGEAPVAMGLSPDGLTAVVLHSMSLSEVDLASGTLVGTTALGFPPAAVAVDGAGNAYVQVKGSSYDKLRIQAVRLGTGPGASAVSTFSSSGHTALRPGSNALYATGSSYNPVFERYDTTGGGLVFSASSAGDYSHQSCGALWLSEAGDRIYTGCGQTFLASTDLASDMSWTGTLAGVGNFTIRHLSNSAMAGTTTALVAESSYYYTPEATTLRRWSAVDLGLLDSNPLPTMTSGASTYRWYGRYVFYRSDGSERYVVLQLEPAAGVVNGFGYVTF